MSAPSGGRSAALPRDPAPHPTPTPAPAPAPRSPSLAPGPPSGEALPTPRSRPRPHQVFILDSLALYMPTDAREAESIIERVTPRLQHANSAVVLSAVKVMIKYMDLITNQDSLKSLYKKMAPPLVTLLSSEPEIQYVSLRNINLIVQKRPYILAHEIKVFFCKYNDPIYVKMEKLEIMIKLASDRNVDQVQCASARGWTV